MAINIANGKRKKIVVLPDIHPHYRATVRTYLMGTDAVITGDENLRADLSDVLTKVDGQTACLVIQNPNFFGQLLDINGLADKVHAAGALLVVVANPAMSMGLLTRLENTARILSFPKASLLAPDLTSAAPTWAFSPPAKNICENVRSSDR
jgi:glycine cleavage system pyridoxal-binding protein P